MKRTLINCLLISIAALTITSCKDECPTPTTTTPTETQTTLKIITEGSLGFGEKDVVVSLFKNLEDYNGNKNVYKVASTDHSGEVIFSDITPGSLYYFKAEKDCENSYEGKNKQYVSANVENTVNVALKSYGSLTFKNNSTDTKYTVWINGSVSFNSELIPKSTEKSTFTLKNVPIGTYDVRITQDSNFTTEVYDKHFSVYVVCGESSIVTFP